MRQYMYKGPRQHQIQAAKSFARCYDELKLELRYLDGSPGSPTVDGMPHGTGTSDRTANMAMKRLGISRDIDLIEQTAMDVSDKGMYPYLLEAVVHNMTFKELQERKIPCSKNTLTAYKKKYYQELWERMQQRR